MYLRKLGVEGDQDWVFDRSGLDPSEGRGLYTKELARALRRIGFRVGEVWYDADGAAGMVRRFDELHRDLAAGVPSIVCMHYDDPPLDSEHFRLVLGYDGKRDEVIFHEPAEEKGAYRRMTRRRFSKLWPLKGGGREKGKRILIRLRLEPGELEQGKIATVPTAADLAQQVMALRDRVPPGHTVLAQPPFVVIGDEPPARVRQRALGTVKWTVDKLKKDFFSKDPEEIIEIWLFRDRDTYRQGSLRISGHAPSTPYGYYLQAKKAMVMNIATGGGTLVHEIVHPFMAANFPACPAWYNEGLGSLFEQSAERNERIVGLPNWRLAGLQDAIGEGSMPSFRWLLSRSDEQFYNRDPGTNYAQARYLCLYLQEHGLLTRFHHEFLRHHGRDPSGYRTLKRVLRERDMDAFKERWQKWVMSLRYP